MENDIESTGIPSNEEHIEALKETLRKSEIIVKQKLEILKRHSSVLDEMDELSTIIIGLYKKLESLKGKDQKSISEQTQSEGKGNKDISQTERINNLHSQILGLEKEHVDLKIVEQRIKEEIERADSQGEN